MSCLAFLSGFFSSPLLSFKLPFPHHCIQPFNKVCLLSYSLAQTFGNLETQFLSVVPAGCVEGGSPCLNHWWYSELCQHFRLREPVPLTVLERSRSGRLLSHRLKAVTVMTRLKESLTQTDPLSGWGEWKLDFQNSYLRQITNKVFVLYLPKHRTNLGLSVDFHLLMSRSLTSPWACFQT